MLVATVAQLEATATDDALDSLELPTTAELIGKARTEEDKQVIKRHPKLARASAMLAVAVEVLLEAPTWGSDEDVRVVTCVGGDPGPDPARRAVRRGGHRDRDAAAARSRARG